MTLGRLTADHLPEIVILHGAAFGGFFLSQLGPRFLKEYYRCVQAYPGGIAVGLWAGAQLRGFVAGFVDPPAFYRFLRGAWFRLGVAAAFGLVRDPSLLRRFLVNYRRTGEGTGVKASAGRMRPGRHAELASLAVHPSAEGRGYGSALVREFTRQAAALEARLVTLTTDAVNNDAVNAFYQRLGFRLAEGFEAQPGRRLNRYEHVIGETNHA